MTIAVRPSSRRGERPLDAQLRGQVDRRGGLVEDQEARVGDQRPGEGQELALAGREPPAALLDDGVEALGQVLDERERAHGVARPRAARRRSASGRPKRRFSATVPLNRKPSWGTIPSWARREAWVTVAQVVAVDQDGALVRVVEAGQQLGQRRLAGPGGARPGPRSGRRGCAARCRAGRTRARSRSSRRAARSRRACGGSADGVGGVVRARGPVSSTPKIFSSAAIADWNVP